jgi:hypothetical protein
MPNFSKSSLYFLKFYLKESFKGDFTNKYYLNKIISLDRLIIFLKSD